MPSALSEASGGCAAPLCGQWVNPCPIQLLKAGGGSSGAVVHLQKNLDLCQLGVERDQKIMLLAGGPLRGLQRCTGTAEFPVWFHSQEFMLEQRFLAGACLVFFLMTEKILSLKYLTPLLHSCRRY